MFQSRLNQSPQVSMFIRSERSSPFGFSGAACLLECLCILGQRIIKEHPDELGFVGVAFQSSNFRQRLVFVGTDVGSCQFGSGLSLIRHGLKTIQRSKTKSHGASFIARRQNSIVDVVQHQSIAQGQREHAQTVIL